MIQLQFNRINKDSNDLIYLICDGQNFNDICGNKWTFEKNINFGNIMGGGVIVDQVAQCPFGKLTGNSQRTLEYWITVPENGKWNVFAQSFAVGYGSSGDKEYFSVGPLGVGVVGADNVWWNQASHPSGVTEITRSIFGTNQHHVAATYNGSTIKMYIDGKLYMYKNIVLNTQSSNFFIGYCPHWDVQRQINNSILNQIRVSNIVRYTENFTPVPFYMSFINNTLKLQ